MSSEFKLPFDTYDFFGYLLPGTLLSLGLSFIFWDRLGDIVLKFIPGFGPKVEVDATVAILFVLVAIMTFYFLGHLVGCLAHIIYDRMIVRNILVYPFYSILDLKTPLNRVLPAAARIRWFLLIVAGVSAIVTPALLLFGLKWWCLVICIVIIAALKWISYNCSGNEKIAEKCKRICKKMHDKFREFTVTDVGVNETLCNKFFERLEKTTGLKRDDVKDYNSDIYWLAYTGLVQEKDGSHHEGKISNWLCLYGCLRNYSCAFLMMSAVTSFRLWMVVFCECENVEIPRYVIIIAATLLLSFLLFMRYWIFYYAYYSKYIIRTYAVGEYSSTACNAELSAGGGNSGR